MSVAGPDKVKRVQFHVASISCVACTRVFRKGLRGMAGIKGVKELPMLNRVVVEYDPLVAEEAQVKEGILDVAARAGLNGRVFISR